MTHTDEELKYWNAFHFIKEVGPRRFKKIINFFPDIKYAYYASEKDYLEAGLDRNTIDSIIITRQHIDIHKEYEKVLSEGIRIITIQDEYYPKLLKEIYDPPPALYVRGNLMRDELALAVVGTRKHSLYGKQVTQELTEALCTLGITVVSGLAKGIDAIAHQICVKNKHRTIAVTGSGIDSQSIYPSINRSLAKQVEHSGAVISEYPIGTLPVKQNFPRRNRIISGLCVGVLIIEAPEASGALITARYALEQNREVFAIPGPIYSANSQGTHALIQSGAKLVTRIEDIVEELHLSMQSLANPIHTQPIPSQDPEEELLLTLLSREPIHIDSLIKDSQLSASRVNSVLTLLEIQGRIKNLGGMNYVLVR